MGEGDVFSIRRGVEKGGVEDGTDILMQIYIYETNSSNRKPHEMKITHKKLSFNDVKKEIGSMQLRLFNSDGA